MKLIKLAWRQTWRDLAAGEIRLMLLALIIAVLAVTAVSFITDRAEQGLQQEANRLLGGDAALRADTPIAESVPASAKKLNLNVAQTASFPSMVQTGAAVSLADIKAVDDQYPLRGEFEIQRGNTSQNETVRGGPKPGTLWLSADAARKLNAQFGQAIGVGDAQLIYAATLLQEPDAALDYFNVAPKVMIALRDLPSTGLVQNGSRIQYRLVVAGNKPSVQKFVQNTRKNLQRGQRLESSEDARPEVRSALDRAGRFLSLAALVSLILAAVAIALAARRHSARHLDGSAVMRCLGASQATIAFLQLGELFFLGLVGSGIGIGLAWLLQLVVGGYLSNAMGVVLPAASLQPIWAGFAIGFTVLLAFAVPPVLALRKVPALRVLRRDVPISEPSAWAVGLLGLSGLGALLWWKADSAVLGGLILGGIVITALVLAGIAWLLLRWLKSTRHKLHGPWRYGLANLSRHQGMTLTQVSALGLGLMALLLLTFVRTDLLSRWQQTLPSDAPNRFVINVQPDQLPAVTQFVQDIGLQNAQLFPMVRARLQAVNGKAVTGSSYKNNGERAMRLAEREFNLSSVAEFGKDNTLVAGKFWSKNHSGALEMSVEQGFAESLNWKLGDVVRFDVAGTKLSAKITSFRKIEWESFKPNFFVVISPNGLQGLSASYISALYVPKDKQNKMDDLVRQFPNLSVIDIEAVLKQVRSTVDQVSRVVESVFYFSLFAGLLVLLAAVQASQDERMREAGVMRVLGASKKQLRLAQATEFASLGLLAGLVASISASVIASLIATKVFSLPWSFNLPLIFYGVLGGTTLALLAGLWATRKVTQVPPMETLRSL
ncbi:MAG: FtsX-like permease family protein [Arenimonas sp.]|nr:FtsX-like permease family protein [Arenimonas sp.]